jgi:hypothetical protein
MPQPLVFVTWGDPWGSDDDTDIEYVYLHLMNQHGTFALSPLQILQGWTAHINNFIWVSNATARQLMSRGIRPPATGMFTTNPTSLMIDAQLTTEFLGLFFPGSPPAALASADLPIRTTACGYAAHAAQFYAVLHALAPALDRTLTARDQALWLVTEARRYLPDSSKSADIVDFVLADFLSNPDPDDWESTRDRVHLRYQQNAAANGFIYRAWYESSVNFASGLIALLYGGTDYRRTVQIGTLSGWDSDNGTATMGGLVAFIGGRAALAAAFPGPPLSERYQIYRTRENLPDYLPLDPVAEDTFQMMAQRMIPLVEAGIVASGGLVDAGRGAWLLPPAVTGDWLARSPTNLDDARSANNRVRREGGNVLTQSSVTSAPWCCAFGSGDPSFFANGLEQDFSGAEEPQTRRGYYSTQNAGTPQGGSVTLSVVYDRAVPVEVVRFIEGEHFSSGSLTGGWFESVAVEVRFGGAWTAAAVTPSEPLDPIALPAPPSFDLTGDGRRDAEDLYAWHAMPTDLDGDAEAGVSDREYLQLAVRWMETTEMIAPTRLVRNRNAREGFR